MANKKKTKKKTATRAKRATGKKKRPAGRKETPTKGRAKKRRTPTESARKKLGKKAKRKAQGSKATGEKTVSAGKKQNRRKSQRRELVAFLGKKPDLHSGEQSGDLQGLSQVEGADSESVQELLEEGNAFEAGVVKGVEDAGDRRGREVRTQEVPEDDVPDEYLDKD
jgi:hypothetical protein